METSRMNQDRQPLIGRADPVDAHRSTDRGGDFRRGVDGHVDRREAAMILRAARHADAGRREELTDLALGMMPDSRPVLRLHVRALFEADDCEGAHALTARGLLIWPNDATLMQYRAQALNELGRRNEALDEIQRLLHRQPHRVGALVFGAEVAGEAGQRERAVIWLARAHLLRPWCERIKQLLAEALVRSERAAAALELINTLPRPMPLLRARVLRMLGRLCEAAEVLRATIEGGSFAGEPLPEEASEDELITEALIVAELRGDHATCQRLSSRLNDRTPRAMLQLARMNLSRGAFRRALRVATRLMNDASHGQSALAIIVAAAGMIQRNRLARRSLIRLRSRYGEQYMKEMHACWRRAMLGRIVNDQRNPRRACADPASSLLQPMLQQAAGTLERRMRRHTVAGSFDVERLRQHERICRDALNLHSRAEGGPLMLKGGERRSQATADQS